MCSLAVSHVPGFAAIVLLHWYVSIDIHDVPGRMLLRVSILPFARDLLQIQILLLIFVLVIQEMNQSCKSGVVGLSSC